MINFIPQTSTFHLQGKSISYVFAVDKHGFLRHLYFGEKLNEGCDLRYLMQTAWLGTSVNFDGAEGLNDNLNAMMLENSCGQLGDFRRPSVQIALPNGSRLTDFRYNSHEILQNHTLPELPHARGGETLRIVLADEANNLQLNLFYTVFSDCNVVVRSASVTNNSAQDVFVEKLSSFCLDVYDDNRDVLQLVGNWASERGVVRTPAHKGILQITSGARGVSSHTTNPFVSLLSPGATETSGEVIAVNLVYSGSFAIDVENSSLHSCRVQGGIDCQNFRWKLGAGQTFHAPQAVLTCSDSGLGQASRNLHNFYRLHLINPKFAFARRPVVVNNWEATYFDFNNQKLFDIIDCAAQLGIDTFVLDDGWFTNRNNDTNGLGDWEVNLEKLQGGLLPIAQRCHQNGLKFGLWFEPEMVNEGTKLFAEHPDYVLHNPHAGRVRSRNQLVLDFTNPQVVEHIAKKMSQLIRQNDVDYIKWDMNRYLADLYSISLPAECMGEVTHRYVLGVYKLAQMLTDRFPDLLMEGCSGGGGRFDAGMLFYFPQIWTSDNTDAYCRTFIQHGTSICYPPSAMTAHLSVCPNHQTGRTTSFESRYNVARQCTFGYELDITQLSEEEKQQVKQQVQEYAQEERLVVEGDLYRLANSHDDGLWAVCQVNKQQTFARVVGMYGLILENNRGKLLKIDGLADEATYIVKEFGLQLDGKTLRTAGLLLPQTMRDFQTFCLHLERIN